MQFEVSDSHYHRLAAVSTLHVLVPRDELEYAMCQVYSMKINTSRSLLRHPPRRIRILHACRRLINRHRQHFLLLANIGIERQYEIDEDDNA